VCGTHFGGHSLSHLLQFKDMKLRDSVWSLMITPAAGWCGQGTCEASDMRLGHEERTQRERMK